MSNLAKLIAEGEIPVEELSKAQDLIDRAEIVTKGIAACKKTIVFPLGVKQVDCYTYEDSAGEYRSWGFCTNDGIFNCFCNWGGNHTIGACNLTNFSEVFMAFDKPEFEQDLKRFLSQQIEAAN